jgi:hypothetical protein
VLKEIGGRCDIGSRRIEGTIVIDLRYQVRGRYKNKGKGTGRKKERGQKTLTVPWCIYCGEGSIGAEGGCMLRPLNAQWNCLLLDG